MNDPRTLIFNFSDDWQVPDNDSCDEEADGIY